jgi:xylulokinase
VTDPSDASATLLWNVALDGWDRDLCRAVGVDPGLLPPLADSAAAAGGLDGDAAAAWGLPAGVPVSVGCADAAATILGIPAQVGRYTVTVGSGAQIVLPRTEVSATAPIRHHTYRQADASYYAMAAVMNAGLALSHVVRLLDASWDELYRPYDATTTVPGFLPFFSGERLPVAVPAAAGGWFDVGLETTRADLLAGALEGVAFAVLHAMNSMPEADDETVDLTGGGSRSPVFVSLLADVLGRPLRRVERRDATALGAAKLGWQVAGRPQPTRQQAGTAVVEPTAGSRGRQLLAERYARFVARTAQVGAA